jgi:hypothetical protein
MPRSGLLPSFLNDAPHGGWRYSRIIQNPDHPHVWKDIAGRPSFSPDANCIATRSASEVLYVLRNALAHGNIINLDAKGHEEKGSSRVKHLAFLSRCEAELAAENTYHVVIVKEADFLPFNKAWENWVAEHRQMHVDDLVG